MTRKIITLLSFLLALNLNQFSHAESIAKNVAGHNSEILDGFVLKPAMTFEYQGVQVDNFSENSFGHQLKNFDNIVLGLNFRVHKYLGFNFNWAKSSLESNSFDNAVLSEKQALNLQNFNATSVLYFPLIGDHWLEGFAEIGVSDVQSELKLVDLSGVGTKQKSHETAPLYGLGIQFMPYDYDIAFRFGVQKIQTNLGLANSSITTFRGGVIIPF